MYETKKNDGHDPVIDGYQHHQPSQNHNSAPVNQNDFDRVIAKSKEGGVLDNGPRYR